MSHWISYWRLPGLQALTYQKHWGASWGSCPHRAARWPGCLFPLPAVRIRQSGSEWPPPRPSHAHWPADHVHWRSPGLWLKLPGPLRKREGESIAKRRTPGARQGDEATSFTKFDNLQTNCKYDTSLPFTELLIPRKEAAKGPLN